MSAVVFLLLALAIIVVGSVAVYLRQRTPSSLDAGIDSFRREMDALAVRHDNGVNGSNNGIGSIGGSNNGIGSIGGSNNGIGGIGGSNNGIGGIGGNGIGSGSGNGAAAGGRNGSSDVAEPSDATEASGPPGTTPRGKG